MQINEWRQIAESLGDDGVGLRLELDHLAADPSPARLSRAISAAFWTAERHGGRSARSLIDDMREAIAAS